MEFNNILLCVIAAIIAILPVQFIKEYTETKNGLWLILSSVSYILLTIVYINVLANKDIVIIYPMLKIGSIVGLVMIKFMFFNDNITVKALIGLLLGIMAIKLLSHELHFANNPVKSK
jgi:multidrug transporter EmrE-like cation transporter